MTGVRKPAGEPDRTSKPGVYLPAEIAARVKAGHDLEPDHPDGLSTVARWTCSRCGESVLSYRDLVYGGAIERHCADDSEGRNPS